MAHRGPTVGGPSVLSSITRVAGDRPQGSAALYAYGYADYAELVGASPWDVAGAVVDGLLEPLCFVELVIAQHHGLAGLERLAAKEPSVMRAIRAGRPATVAEIARVRIPGKERVYGLGDLWAFGHADIAGQIQRDTQVVWNAQKSRLMRVDQLGTVIAYVKAALPERQRTKLGLVE